MLTGEIKNKIDYIWDTFWFGGISNPLEIIEQMTYILFLRSLDDLHTLEVRKDFENSIRNLRIDCSDSQINACMQKQGNYPGIRHAGTPSNDIQTIEMRDIIAFSILLNELAPYLTTQLNTEVIYGGR